MYLYNRYNSILCGGGGGDLGDYYFDTLYVSDRELAQMSANQKNHIGREGAP